MCSVSRDGDVKLSRGCKHRSVSEEGISGWHRLSLPKPRSDVHSERRDGVVQDVVLVAHDTCPCASFLSRLEHELGVVVLGKPARLGIF